MFQYQQLTIQQTPTLPCNYYRLPKTGYHKEPTPPLQLTFFPNWSEIVTTGERKNKRSENAVAGNATKPTNNHCRRIVRNNRRTNDEVNFRNDVQIVWIHRSFSARVQTESERRLCFRQCIIWQTKHWQKQQNPQIQIITQKSPTERSHWTTPNLQIIADQPSHVIRSIFTKVRNNSYVNLLFLLEKQKNNRLKLQKKTVSPTDADSFLGTPVLHRKCILWLGPPTTTITSPPTNALRSVRLLASRASRTLKPYTAKNQAQSTSPNRMIAPDMIDHSRISKRPNDGPSKYKVNCAHCPPLSDWTKTIACCTTRFIFVITKIIPSSILELYKSPCPKVSFNVFSLPTPELC